MSTQAEIKEHLIELFEQSGVDKPSGLVDATLWVLNEDGVVLKVEVPAGMSLVIQEGLRVEGFTVESLSKAGLTVVASLLEMQKTPRKPWYKRW